MIFFTCLIVLKWGKDWGGEARSTQPEEGEQWQVGLSTRSSSAR